MKLTYARKLKEGDLIYHHYRYEEVLHMCKGTTPFVKIIMSPKSSTMNIGTEYYLLAATMVWLLCRNGKKV